MRLAIAVDPAERFRWVERLDFRSAGIEPRFLRVGGDGAAPSEDGRLLRCERRGERLLPNFADVLAALDDDAAEACLVAGRGPLAALGRAAAELTGLPVVELLETLERLPGPGSQRGGRPDLLLLLLLLADPALLSAALNDPRYGSTLVAVGDPGRDPELAAPGAVADETAFADRGAGARLLAVLDRWRRSALEPEEPELSVIVPAYNEEDNVALVCDRLLDALQGVRAEILIVDDASRDATYERALEQMWRSPRIRAYTKPPPRGMGNGIRFGLSRARARFIAVTMGDGSDEVSRIPEMLARVRDEGYSLAIGSRYRHRRNYQSVPRIYRFWSACFRLVTRWFIGFGLSDYTNAFRLFDRRIFERYGPESGGFEISPEITFKAWFASRRVTEVDVRHLKRASGQSSFSFLRAGPGYGKILIKAFVQRLTGRWFVLDW